MNLKIEFVGYPGSGKTTLTKYFEKEFIKSKIEFNKSDKFFFEYFSENKIDNVLLKLFYFYKTTNKFKSKKLFKKQYFFLKRKIEIIIKKKKLHKTIENFKALLNHTDLNIDGKIRSLDNFKIDLCSYHLNDKKDKKIIIYDDGLIQKVFQNYVVEKNFSEIKKNIFKYLNSIPYPSIVIKVNTSFKNSLNNTKKRNEGFIYSKNLKDKKKVYLEIDRMLHKILNKKKTELINYNNKKIDFSSIYKIREHLLK